MDIENSDDTTDTQSAESSGVGWAWRRLALLAIAAAAVAIGLVVLKPESTPPTESSVATTAPVADRKLETTFGCPITDVGTSAAPDAGYVDPGCTDAAMLSEYCGVPRESVQTPGLEGQMAGGLSRTYQTTDGDAAGSVLHYIGDSGPPQIAVAALCVNGQSYNFTAADWDRFTEPA